MHFQICLMEIIYREINFILFVIHLYKKIGQIFRYIIINNARHDPEFFYLILLLLSV